MMDTNQKVLRVLCYASPFLGLILSYILYLLVARIVPGAGHYQGTIQLFFVWLFFYPLTVVGYITKRYWALLILFLLVTLSNELHH